VAPDPPNGSGAAPSREVSSGLLSAPGVSNKHGILEEQAARRPVVEHLPFFYSIHLNKPCNQRCIMCKPAFNHRRDTLSFDGFVTLFDQIKPYAEHVTLMGGEPLMYPWLPEVLAFLGEHEIEVSINTNATMLNDRVLPGLLGLHALNLKCSIHASTPETYYRVHGREHFERVTQNIRRFADLTRDMDNMRLITVYVVMRENLPEVVPFLDFARTLDPHRVEFHPVLSVSSWEVENGSGWDFVGREQVCESFPDEYNETLRHVAERCEREGMNYEVIPI
jgi:MoaA/NifB/PqqE/SkfB family radical SAM enzyme